MPTRPIINTPSFGLEWVIVGGESGPNARPIHPDWVRGIQKQCEEVKVPFLFKQYGEWYPDKKGIYEGKESKIFGNTTVHKLGKKNTGCMLDGKTYKEFPNVTR